MYIFIRLYIRNVELVYSFIFGICIGSFLNVVIDRKSCGKSIVYPPSKCDGCRRRIRGYDLIPIFSYLYLKGRCRFCHIKLSLQYPLIEFITGCVFVFLAYYSLYIVYSLPFLFYSLVIFCCVITVIATDVKYRIILDEVVIFGIAVSTVYLLLFHLSNLPNHLLSALIFGLFFLFLFLITKGKGMGFGDVKFSFFMGLALGFPKIIVSFYLAFLTGALVSLILVIGGKKTFKNTIPFGPYLALAMGISLLFGDWIWQNALSILNL